MTRKEIHQRWIQQARSQMHKNATISEQQPPANRGISPSTHKPTQDKTTKRAPRYFAPNSSKRGGCCQ